MGALYFSNARRLNDALVGSGALVPLSAAAQNQLVIELRVPSLWERALHDLEVPVNLPRLSAYPIIIRHGPREQTAVNTSEVLAEAERYATRWAANGVPSTWNGDRSHNTGWQYAVKLGFPERAVTQQQADCIEAEWRAMAPVRKEGVQYVRRAGRSLCALNANESALDLKLSRPGGRAYFVFHIYIQANGGEEKAGK